MTDKLSSPSGSSGSGSAISPRSKSSASSPGGAYLVVSQQPPKYVYSNESFELKLSLVQTGRVGSPSSISSNGEIEIHTTLQDARSGQMCGSEALLITEPSRIVLAPEEEPGSRRSCVVKCRIRMDSIRRDHGVALDVKFTSRLDNANPSTAVGSVSTNAIHMVNYKICITMEEDWGKVWFKDEGGRDKSMEIFASIFDKDGTPRTGEQIPLVPTLCYNTSEGKPVRVSNQDILRILGTKKSVIDKDSGKANIRFRVEDVSKNHQGQDFMLEVSPDLKAKGFKDVAPAYTSAVNVRSKRNKRQRVAASSSRAGGRGSPITSRARFEEPSEGLFPPVEIPRLQEALKSVINWAEDVVNGLYPLQWQLIGYQQHPDGSHDYQRPYHNMPNPNPQITRILTAYSESIRDNLRMIMSAFEQSGSLRVGDPSFLPAGVQNQLPPHAQDDPYSMMRNPSHVPHHAMQSMAGRSHNVHPGAMSQYPHDRPTDERMAVHSRAQFPMGQAMSPSLPPYMRGPGESQDLMMPSQPSARRPMPSVVDLAAAQHGLGTDEDTRESEVGFVLAKQYKALHTGDRLGFPAYSMNKEILGFYREAPGKGGVREFSPIANHRSDFGPLQIMQATDILEAAMAKKSEAVHALTDWGSIDNLLDHAVVYDWSKDIGQQQDESRAS